MKHRKQMFSTDTHSRYGRMLRIARTPWLLSSLLFAFGVTLLALGVSHGVIAEDDGLTIQYNDVRFAEASNAILSYLEGSFGALVMVVAGLVAIISAAFGQYRAAMGCLIIAVGAFILRSFISTFFNDGNIMP
jgi:hypothetical protein